MIDYVVHGQTLPVPLQVLDDIFLRSIVAAFHHLLDKPRVSSWVALGIVHGLGESLQEGIHVGPGRAAVDTNTGTLVVHLSGMTGGAGKTEVVFALVAVFHEPDGQGIWVAQGDLLRQVVIVV